MSHDPLIATPTVEIGALTVTRKLLDKIIWMIENPKAKAALVRVHDEAQLVISQASAQLIAGATVKEAAQRKRAEYWHPYDLLSSRIRISEQVRDLKNGIIRPEDTRYDLSWRGVSKDGLNWRTFSNTYETFVDELGIAYQFSVNSGVERIDPPADLIVV
ncbi:MAG: hypothetical protein F6K09_03660 [Merismopedia sp. SIO2A8]|nr:hypothetical protein [Symploca sp. SIO2B6]NET47821.1 hypothetical protein [Merismopedia sp. SIO2A8]